MSKRLQVVKLVEELIGLKAAVEVKEKEIDAVLGVKKPGRKPGKKARKAPKAPGASVDGDDPKAPTGDRILHMMKSDRTRSFTASDAVEKLGISMSAWFYNISAMLKAKKVKQVKRGHYQARGRK